MAQLFSPNFEFRSVPQQFFNRLTNEERQQGYLYATAHIADESMDATYEVYESKIISNIFWPPRSLILVATIFTLGVKAYRNNPFTTKLPRINQHL
jgi:hypothetical protein